MSETQKRREYTQKMTDALMGQLEVSGVSEFEHTAICMTGSYGRLEANETSDLDVMLVSEDQYPDPKNPEHENVLTRILRPRISNLDEIRLKATLVEAVRAVELPDFDSDGRYLTNYSTSHLIGMIGRVADDSSNAFTSRMLLLLEGRALTNPAILDAAREAIVASYWRDYKGVDSLFAPAFMSNDILRMWRTFCVNYEARTAAIPADQRNKRRLKNYKLKYSRMLTCYSAILAMLDVYQKASTVTPDDMMRICRLTPLERILDLRKAAASLVVQTALDGIIFGYEEFLERMNEDKEDLLKAFADPGQLKEMLEASYKFADSIFDSIDAIGARTKLHRMVVV